MQQQIKKLLQLMLPLVARGRSCCCRSTCKSYCSHNRAGADDPSRKLSPHRSSLCRPSWRRPPCFGLLLSASQHPPLSVGQFGVGPRGIETCSFGLLASVAPLQPSLSRPSWFRPSWHLISWHTPLSVGPCSIGPLVIGPISISPLVFGRLATALLASGLLVLNSQKQALSATCLLCIGPLSISQGEEKEGQELFLPMQQFMLQLTQKLLLPQFVLVDNIWA